MIRFSEVYEKMTATSNIVNATHAPINVIRASEGTATLPSVSFTGDTDTGIFLPAPDTISITTGGRSRLLVEDTGATRICGDLMPAANATQQIGTSNMRFNEAWIDTLRISSTHAIEKGQDDSVIINTEGINVSTTGLGVTNVTSAQGVNITASGADSLLDIKSTGAGGRVVLSAATEIAMSAPWTTFGANLIVEGDLNVNGAQFITNVQNLNVQDPVILVNSGETGAGVTSGNGFAGLRVDRGSATDHQLLFNETSDKFVMGPIGEEIPIASETYVDTRPISTSNIISGTLGVARGGTGITTYTGVVGSAVVLNSNASIDYCTVNDSMWLGGSASNINMVGTNATWTNADNINAGTWRTENGDTMSLLSSYLDSPNTPYPEHGLLAAASGRQRIMFMDNKQSVIDTAFGSYGLNSFRITEGQWHTYNDKTYSAGFTIDVGKSTSHSDSNIGYPLYLNQARRGRVVIGSNLAAGNRIYAQIVSARGVNLTSDDRLKDNEIYITNATNTINRLRPQLYEKWSTMDFRENSNADFIKEAGFIAQEVFYDTPELRHLVTLPVDADSNALYTSTTQSSTTPSIDPSYTEWGTSTASLDYIGLIPYLVKCVQEKNAQLFELESRVAILEHRRFAK